MTQLAVPASFRPATSERRPRVAALVSAVVLAGVGLVIAAVGISFPVVEGILASGRVAAPPRDVAMFASVAPLWGILVLFGIGQVAGAVGAIDRGRVGSAVALVAAGLLLVSAVAAQLAGTIGSLELDAAGHAVAAAVSGLAGVAILGIVLSARR